MQTRIVEQYKDPLKNNIAFDTLSEPSVTIEFTNDGNYMVSGDKIGTYTMTNDSSYTLKPFEYEFIFHFDGGGNLMTKRIGNPGEQVKILDPNTIGAYFYANVNYVFTDYLKP